MECAGIRSIFQMGCSGRAAGIRPGPLQVGAGRRCTRLGFQTSIATSSSPGGPVLLEKNERYWRNYNWLFFSKGSERQHEERACNENWFQAIFRSWLVRWWIAFESLPCKSSPQWVSGLLFLILQNNSSSVDCSSNISYYASCCFSCA